MQRLPLGRTTIRRPGFTVIIDRRRDSVRMSVTGEAEIELSPPRAEVIRTRKRKKPRAKEKVE